MSDLRVDYELLGQSEKTLTSLIGDFQHLRARTGACDSALGSPAIAAAMGGFAGNWDYHREKLVSSMKSLRTMTGEALHQFRGTDGRLASGIARKP